MDRKNGFVLLGIGMLILVVGCFWHMRKEGLSGGIQKENQEALRQSQEDSCTRQLFAMDTYMEFTAYGTRCEEAVEAAVEEVLRLDALLSTGDEDSEVSWWNQSGSICLSKDTERLLYRALDLYEETDGIFDITIYPLMKLWGFTNHEYHVPTQEELDQILPLVDASRITMEESSQDEGTTAVLGEGQEVDFGGIAKGYTSARVMEIFESYGVSSGIVSLGGNVQVFHGKPDGSDWNVGIRDPEGSQTEPIGVVSVVDRAVITSGGYERYFTEAGRTYIHIIDPRTGYPVEGDLLSVTIVSADGTLADALSTSLYIMGLDQACEFWRGNKDEFDMVLITNDKEIFVSEGIADQFQSQAEVTVVE